MPLYWVDILKVTYFTVPLLVMICSHHRTPYSDFLTVTSLVIIVDVADTEDTRVLHERMNELNNIHGLIPRNMASFSKSISRK